LAFAAFSAVIDIAFLRRETPECVCCDSGMVLKLTCIAVTINACYNIFSPLNSALFTVYILFNGNSCMSLAKAYLSCQIYRHLTECVREMAAGRCHEESWSRSSIPEQLSILCDITAR